MEHTAEMVIIGSLALMVEDLSNARASMVSAFN